MLKRSITGMCLFLAAIPIVIFYETPLLEAAVAALSAIAVFEMLRCLGLHKNYFLSVPSYIMAVASPASVRYLDRISSAWVVIFAVIYAYALYVLACAMFSQGKIRFKDAAKAFFSTMYIICGFSCVVASSALEHGRFYLIMIVAVAFATDIFAYFSGMLFGKHKLIPAVSPKKTVEGAVGGTVISAAAFVGCAFLYSAIYPENTARPNVLVLIVAGVLLSVVSQIGDLIASYIKRERNVKDYGRLFPGHGGVLDRFDSVIAVAPLMFLMFVNSGAVNAFG